MFLLIFSAFTEMLYSYLLPRPHIWWSSLPLLWQELLHLKSFLMRWCDRLEIAKWLNLNIKKNKFKCMRTKNILTSVHIGTCKQKIQIINILINTFEELHRNKNCIFKMYMKDFSWHCKYYIGDIKLFLLSPLLNR